MGRTRSNSRVRSHHNPQRSATVQSPKACYIYGIVNTGTKLTLRARPIGPRGTKVYTVPYHDIAALVSNTDFEEYDPTEENLLIHNEVMQEVLVQHGCTVIPLRLSTIAKSEDDVVHILSAGYLDFKEKLSSLEGKVEIGVKVFCDIQGLVREIAREDNYQNATDIDERICQRACWLASTLLERLKTVSEQSQLNDIVFEDMIMNAAFLVKRERLQEFFEEVESFDTHYGRNLRIQCTGPYAPYSFTDPPYREEGGWKW